MFVEGRGGERMKGQRGRESKSQSVRVSKYQSEEVRKIRYCLIPDAGRQLSGI